MLLFQLLSCLLRFSLRYLKEIKQVKKAVKSTLIRHLSQSAQFNSVHRTDERRRELKWEYRSTKQTYGYLI